MGRDWTDPDEKITFRVVGLDFSEDGLRVEYVEVAEEGLAKGDEVRKHISTLDEVERWLAGDFNEPDPKSSGEGGDTDVDMGIGNSDGKDPGLADDGQSMDHESDVESDDGGLSDLLPKHALDIDYGEDLPEENDGGHHDHEWENEMEDALRKSKAKDDDYEKWESVRVKLDAVRHNCVIPNPNSFHPCQILLTQPQLSALFLTPIHFHPCQIFLTQPQLHAMMRFERTIRKSHGAYKHFLSRLRDAFFIVNEDDMEVEPILLHNLAYPDHTNPELHSSSRRS